MAHDAAVRSRAEIPAPSSADPFHSRCYKRWPAASLRECVALCGDGAAPVSPASAAEDAFVWELARDGRFVESIWLGWYRNASGGLSSVTAGAAAEYALASAPADLWAPLPHSPVRRRLGPLPVRCAREPDPPRLRLWIVAQRLACRRRGAIGGVVSSGDCQLLRRTPPGCWYHVRDRGGRERPPGLPLPLLGALRALPRENPRGAVPAIHEASALTTSSHTLHNETMRVLDVARRAFASRRWRFRLATFQLGWTICVFFAAPPIQWTFTGLNLSLIIGPAYAHIAMIPVGFVLLSLAVLPIDAFVIRIVCWIQFSGYVVWAALMVVGILALDSPRLCRRQFCHLRLRCSLTAADVVLPSLLSRLRVAAPRGAPPLLAHVSRDACSVGSVGGLAVD